MSNVDLLEKVEAQFVEEAKKALEEFSHLPPMDKDFAIQANVPSGFLKEDRMKYHRFIRIRTRKRRTERMNSYEDREEIYEYVCVRVKGTYGHKWARISDLRGDEMKKFVKKGKKLLQNFGPAIRKEILEAQERVKQRQIREQEEVCDIRRSLKEILEG